MKPRFSLLFISLLCSLSFVGATSRQPNTKYLLKLPISELKAQIAKIRASGADVAGVNLQIGTADLIATADQLASLSNQGIKSTRSPERLGFGNPDPRYKTSDQVANILSSYQKTYPHLAKVQVIGKSAEGRDIVAIKITENVERRDGAKPAVLFNGMHHAREVMSTEVPLDIVDYLLSNYGKDPKVTHWLASSVVYVIPMLNVDGNNHVWNEDPMWRKNGREVDINRNYPYRWNDCGGSSSNEGADDYHGPAAGSEPETQVLMSFVKDIHPVFDISFHSYSELVIYPYGCGEHTETADVVEPLGKQIAALIPSDSGSGTYTAGLAPELLYTVDGDDISWMYHEVHVIPFVIEINSDEQGFQPSYEWRDKTVTKLRPAWQLLLDRLQRSSIRGIGAPADATVRVRSVEKANPFSQIYPVRADGRFIAIVNSGEYEVSILRQRKAVQTSTVHVSDAAAQLQFR